MQTYVMENEGMGQHMEDTQKVQEKQYINMNLAIFTTVSVSNNSRSSGKCKANSCEGNARVNMYHLATLCSDKLR